MKGYLEHFSWDRKGFITLTVLILLAFLLVPLVIQDVHVHLFLQIFFSIFVLFTIMTVQKKKRWINYLGISLVLPYLFFVCMSVIYNSFYYLFVAYLFYVIFMILAISAIAYHVFTIKYINTNLIFGAIVIYLLVGVLWGRVYFVVDSISPNSFKGINSVHVDTDGLESGYDTQFDLLYFSMTTLSTLGVGDIVPVTHMGRTLTVLEAMFGQLFVATVIAKMVSAWKSKDNKEII